MLEVWDATGRPVCRFEVFLAASAQGTNWPRDEHEACRLLQEQALETARGSVLGETLWELHGHRYDVT
jgi:hypothetical protein